MLSNSQSKSIEFGTRPTRARKTPWWIPTDTAPTASNKLLYQAIRTIVDTTIGIVANTGHEKEPTTAAHIIAPYKMSLVMTSIVLLKVMTYDKPHLIQLRKCGFPPFRNEMSLLQSRRRVYHFHTHLQMLSPRPRNEMGKCGGR